jgi:flagellar assembly factor FliW
VNIETGRFGSLTVSENEIIHFPLGIFGFPDLKKFCLIDTGDDTLILWLQSCENPAIAFPVLEPKIFKPDYTVRLSGVELRELQLENVNGSVVFNILTIPENVTEMTANLKAPIVINLKNQIGRQVVLQENEYNIKTPMFKELKTHWVTIQSSKQNAGQQASEGAGALVNSPVTIKNIPPSLTVKGLQV